MKIGIPFFAIILLTALTPHARAESALPEPGPVNGGLRLRLLVSPTSKGTNEGYSVHLDLLSVTNRDILLRANWWYDVSTGDLKDYLETATSIETYPAIRPWMGGVMGPHRKTPQPEYLLKAGEVLSLTWQTKGRHLKNSVIDPNTVQNPEFPLPGLYSVHAVLAVPTINGAVLLRSNEQLVSAGGSLEIPKHTYGTMHWIDADTKKAGISLGSLHQIVVGDRFDVGPSKAMDVWTLTITRVDPSYSEGTLERQPRPNQTPAAIAFPQRGMNVTLITQK